MATPKSKRKAAQTVAEPREIESGNGTRTGRAEENPFWIFSVAVYGRDGTAPACLALQDSKGLDVNLLLFCCWAGAAGRPLKPAELEDLIAAVKPWRTEIIQPLRSLRRMLGMHGVFEGASVALLKQLKSAELESEAVQQRMLHECLPLEPGEASVTVAAENLKAYVKLLNVDCDSAATADLAAVLRGAFPSLAPLEAVWTLV